MKSQAFQAEFSDEEDSVVEPQNGKANVANIKANGCKAEDSDSRPVQVVTDTSKSFRLIEPGLMLEGTCLNPDCYAYQKKALHIFGFVQKLNFASAAYEAVCRLCKQNLEYITNIGYYKTTLKIYGKIDGKKGTITKEYTADDGKYHTFKDGEESNVVWNFLELTASKLGK